MFSPLSVRSSIYNLLKQTTKQNNTQTSVLVRYLSDGLKDARLVYSSDDEALWEKKRRSMKNFSNFNNRRNNNRTQNYRHSHTNQKSDYLDFDDSSRQYRGGGFKSNRHEQYLGDSFEDEVSRGLVEDDSWLFQKQTSHSSRPLKKDLYVEHPELKTTSWDDIKPFLDQHHISYSMGENIPKPVLKFEHGNIPEEAMHIINRERWSAPTPIQSVTWPIALSGRDLIGVAQTGSGKTLGYVHPGIVHIRNQPNANVQDGPIGIVIVPTRELSQQVNEVARKFMRPFRIKSVAIYGGQNKSSQMRELEKGADFVIATPGRLNDFLSSGFISLDNCSYLVLDEADRMLDMGFEKQIRNIILSIREDRQTQMWSATWPREVRGLAWEFLKKPIQINVGSTELLANSNIKQTFRCVHNYDKATQICEDVKEVVKNNGKILIFTNTKVSADHLTKKIRSLRIGAASIHSDKSQFQRDRLLKDFKAGIYNVLIATDVAARGLDVNDITHVFNYECPRDIETYVHRIGRTARAGKSGTSITYLVDQDLQVATKIVQLLERNNNEKDEELMAFIDRCENNKTFTRNDRYRSRTYKVNPAGRRYR